MLRDNLSLEGKGDTFSEQLTGDKIIGHQQTDSIAVDKLDICLLLCPTQEM